MIVEFEGITAEINPNDLDESFIDIYFSSNLIRFILSESNWAAINGWNDEGYSIKTEIEGKILNFI